MLRDSAGSFVGVGCKRISRKSEIKLMEASAIIEGLKQVANRVRNYPYFFNHHIVVESDAEVVIKLINGNSMDNSEISVLIDEVKELASHARAIQFSFCPKKANGLAHFLARKASVEDDFFFLF